MDFVSFAIKSPQVFGYQRGWGNGYVAIPKEHPFFGLGYDEIHNRADIEVNGGLTYAEPYNENRDPESAKDMWVLGWDTAHLYDNLTSWPNEASILRENESLIQQLKKVVKPQH